MFKIRFILIIPIPNECYFDNRALLFFHERSLEIKLTVPLCLISVFWISVIFVVVTFKDFTRENIKIEST